MADIEERIAAADRRAEEAVKRAEEAKKRAKQLKNERDLIEARKLRALCKGERADDTRRKILGGALLLEMMKEDETTKAKIMKRLDGFLTRDADRALFGLDAREGEKPAEPVTVSPKDPSPRPSMAELLGQTSPEVEV